MKENYIKLPYFALKIYILSTLILSLFGPINYNYNPIFAFLVFVYILFFLFITKCGMLSSSSYKAYKYTSIGNDKKIIILLKISLVIVIFIKIMLLVSSIKLYGLPEANNFFTMLAKVYSEMHHGEFIENFYRKLDTFTTFLFYFAFFLGFFLFKRINFFYRLILIISVILDLMYQTLFIGTQRSIITIAILSIVLFSIKSIDKNFNIKYKKIIKILFFLIILFVLFLKVISARYGMWNPSYYRNIDIYNLDSMWLFPFKNPRLKYDICNIISYVTQGYYGLSLTFQTNFKWTFFLGAFRGINSIVSQIIPSIPEMADLTYPIRAGVIYNFDGYAQWFTIFPWLASDFTFLGALIYMGLIAKLYMRCWIQVIKYKNPIAFLMLVLLSIQYIFIVANNQLFIQRGESLATIIIFLIYLKYNKKFNYKIVSG